MLPAATKLNGYFCPETISTYLAVSSNLTHARNERVYCFVNRSVPHMRQLGGRALPNPAVSSVLTPIPKKSSGHSKLKGNPFKGHPHDSGRKSSLKIRRPPTLEEDVWDTSADQGKASGLVV